MAIAFPLWESGVSATEAAESARRKPFSERRLEANRRNAQRSTGPRTEAGKRRAARNSTRHGLCAAYSHLPGECDATFQIFVDELRQELCPCTILQRTLFPRIVDLTWRLQRLPETQTKLYALEARKAARFEHVDAPEDEDAPPAEGVGSPPSRISAQCFASCDDEIERVGDDPARGRGGRGAGGARQPIPSRSSMKTSHLAT